MQLKFIALTAFAAGAIANPAVSLPSSVEAALLTVLPASALAAAAESPAAFSKKVASEIKAGATPSWFTKLPPKVESYLLGAGSNATASSNATTAIHGNHTTTGAHHHTTNSLTITTAPGPVVSGSTSSPSAHASSSSSTSSSSTSSGAAAVASAVFGAGMIGAMGIVGVLAL